MTYKRFRNIELFNVLNECFLSSSTLLELDRKHEFTQYHFPLKFSENV